MGWLVGRKVMWMDSGGLHLNGYQVVLEQLCAITFFTLT